jgi:hypothetical protein
VVKLAVAICFRLIRLAPGSIPGRCKHSNRFLFVGLVVVVAFLLVGVKVRKIGMAELWGKRVGGTWMFSEGGGHLFLVGRRGIGS